MWSLSQRRIPLECSSHMNVPEKCYELISTLDCAIEYKSAPQLPPDSRVVQPEEPHIDTDVASQLI
jgi:hypothetical protein